MKETVDLYCHGYDLGLLLWPPVRQSKSMREKLLMPVFMGTIMGLSFQVIGHQTMEVRR
ncbi:hypothetical protein ACLOJK_034352 [Asimina triloba]